MKKKYFYFTLVIGFLFFGGTLFRPISIPYNESDCVKISGVVESIREGGDKDIVFKIQDQKTQFYINRGLEQGFTIDELKDRLIGKNVTILYPEHWTMIDGFSTIKHLSVLKHNGETIFSEIK